MQQETVLGEVDCGRLVSRWCISIGWPREGERGLRTCRLDGSGREAIGHWRERGHGGQSHAETLPSLR